MRNVLVAVLAISAAVTLSGCFGILIASPNACDFDRLPSKTELLNGRGQPDEIKRTANEEIWIYYVRKDVWCGIVPAWFLALPLLLPTCDDYDQFTFVGDESKDAQALRVVASGAGMSWPGISAAKMNHGCSESGSKAPESKTPDLYN